MLLSLFAFACAIAVAFGIKNPHSANYIYDNGEIFAPDVCLSVVNGYTSSYNTTAVCYSCISSSWVRKRYWNYYGLSYCHQGTSESDYEDYYQNTSTFSFYCDGYNSYYLAVTDYTYSLGSKQYQCPYYNVSQYSITAHVTDVCAPKGNRYSKWTCSSGYVYHSTYSDASCTSLLASSLLYGYCNYSTNCDSSSVISSYGYDTYYYYYYGGGTTTSSSGGAVAGIIIGVFFFVFCIVVFSCWWRSLWCWAINQPTVIVSPIRQNNVATTTNQQTVVTMNINSVPNQVPVQYVNMPQGYNSYPPQYPQHQVIQQTPNGPVYVTAQPIYVGQNGYPISPQQNQQNVSYIPMSGYGIPSAPLETETEGR